MLGDKSARIRHYLSISSKENTRLGGAAHWMLPRRVPGPFVGCQ